MIGISFGTRPEFIKIKPVLQELKKREIPFGLIFTGQHQDLLGNDCWSYEKYINHAWTMSWRVDNRLDSIVLSVLENAEELGDFTSIMVQGDTTSAFACALAAFHNNIPVIHLEAGLRTYDNSEPFPEEANRKMISAIASVHFCPTMTAVRNLHREGADNVFLVGNTVFDNIRDVSVGDGDVVLVTMHRRENQENMRAWFEAIEALAKKHQEFDFIIPIHPNPEVKKHQDIFSKVKVVDPMSHDDLIHTLANCKAVITDSGGIQEEAAFMKKFCVVCRKKTERVEGLDNFSLLCSSPDKLNISFSHAMKLPMNGNCPYGDGYSAVRIVDILNNKGKSNEVC